MSQLPGDFWYRFRVASIPLFILGYFSIAALPALMNKGDEMYLLHHWFVFSEVPSRMSKTYGAYVVSIDGKPVSPPARIETAGVLLFDDRHPRPYYDNVVRQLGRLLEADSTSEAETGRAQLEWFVEKRPVVYQVVRIYYNPIDRFRDGTVISEEVLAEYEVR